MYISDDGLGGIDFIAFNLLPLLANTPFSFYLSPLIEPPPSLFDKNAVDLSMFF
jgi:hypothetical protein